MENKKTVGQKYIDHLSKPQDIVDPIEIQREVQKDFIAELEWCIRHAQNKIECRPECPKKCSKKSALDGDIFVEVQTKKEKLMPYVLRNYFIPKKACPTPAYDQSVFHFDHKKETIQYLWTIPDKATTKAFIEHPRLVPEEEYSLLNMVMEFENGELLKKAQLLNKEIKDGVAIHSPIIERL